MADYTFLVYTLSASINGTFTVTGSFTVNVNDPDDNFGIGDDSPLTETGTFPTVTSVGAGGPGAWVGETFVFGGSRGLDATGGSDDALMIKIAGGWQFNHAVEYPGGTTPLVVGNTYTTNSPASVDEEVTPAPVCFESGMNLKTLRGDFAVETLEVGDLVWTMDRGYQPIKWISCKTLTVTEKNAPVVFGEGAIGNAKELRVSPNHKMLVTMTKAARGAQHLVAAKHMVNGTTVYRADQKLVTYYHILFDQHEIVSANGILSESFFPGPNALTILPREKRNEVLTLYPSLFTKSYGLLCRTELVGKSAKNTSEYTVMKSPEDVYKLKAA